MSEPVIVPRSHEGKLTITTPEGVELEMVLAGLGSRFAARLMDSFVRGVLVFIALIAVGATINTVDDLNAGITIALFLLALFGVMFLYDILFEVFNRGQTPGKAVAGIRVVQLGGQPVRFWPSVVRNLLRIVDEHVSIGLVGALSVLATKHEQRLGDLAAGTLVIRVKPSAAPKSTAPPAWVDDPEAPFLLWDVRAITAAEITAVRQFLVRRPTLHADARLRLASQFAERIRPRIAGAPSWPDEQFLVAVVAAKSKRPDAP